MAESAESIGKQYFEPNCCRTFTTRIKVENEVKMARPKRNKYKPTKKKETCIATIKLDAETQIIWNNAKHHRNMSEWVREMLRLHFGDQVGLEQQRLMLLDQSKALAAQKIREVNNLKRGYESRIDDINREIRKIESVMEERLVH